MQSDATKNSSPIRLLTVTGWIIAALWFTIDQGTKWWILKHIMDPPRVIPVTAFFNLVLGWNRGISFGMLSGFALAPWILAVLALVVTVVLLVWLRRTSNWVICVGLGLVVGGALSNAVDRLRHGAVTDFLDFHLDDWHWPAFNLADVGIVIGVTALALDAFATERTTAPASRKRI